MTKYILILTCVLATSAWAEDIEFPDEELARESVLPVFDDPQSVLNRNVTTAQRMELGVGMGMEMNEPYYNDFNLMLQGTYHFNDTSALNVQGISWMDGLSSYGEQLKSGEGSNVKFDPSKAPHPKWALIGNYEFVAYYGKISVTKQSVMNLNLFGLAGLGYMNMGDVSTVVANLGIGQNFYFTKYFAMRLDLRCLIFQGPNAASERLRPQDNPSASDFENRMYYNTQLGLSAIFVL